MAIITCSMEGDRFGPGSRKQGKTVTVGTGFGANNRLYPRQAKTT